MADLLSVAESERVAALGGLDARTQSELGQFFTPVVAAQLIASIPGSRTAVTGPVALSTSSGQASSLPPAYNASGVSRGWSSSQTASEGTCSTSALHIG